MMKRICIALIAFLAVGTIHLNAQTSKEILDKLSAKAKSWKTIYSEFSSTLSDKKNNINTKQEGSVKIKGQKYYLNLPDFNVISDGTTLWSYDKKHNSCTIDNLSDVKDGAFDPSEMFTIWEKDFKHEMKNPAATCDGQSAYEIALFPNKPQGKPYHTILLYVDKVKMEIIKIVVKTRENAEITYKIKNFKSNAEFPDTDFQFNKSKFPGAELIDNRM